MRKDGSIVYDEDIQYRSGPSHDRREVVLENGRVVVASRTREKAIVCLSLTTKVRNTLEMQHTMLNANNRVGKEFDLFRFDFIRSLHLPPAIARGS